MCGIAGLFQSPDASADRSGELHRMLQSIRHRGPDDQGDWQGGGVFLGQRRLSIVDLSPLGHQPMAAVSGRYVIVYNGEIYNHAALRQECQDRGIQFRGHSDTETLLALIDLFGLKAALDRCIGMFAIALWDRERNVLTLARDRLGEKPLYVAANDRELVFASELKAIRQTALGALRVDPGAVLDLLSYGYIGRSRSVLADVEQVRPGEIREYRFDGGRLRQQHSVYWSAVDALFAARAKPFQGSFDEATQAVTALLSDAVGQQMQADVPLGAFLSGGIDSSLVVALMQRQASRPVRTYSIGFNDPRLDEASYAKAVADHLGTEHTQWYVDESEILKLVPDIAGYYDEPLADPSQLPTIILARLTRRDVTVALSGDGADELFGGYPKYWEGPRLFDRSGRRAMGWGASLVGGLISPAASLLPASWTRRVPLHRVESVATLYGASGRHAFIDNLNKLNRGARRFMSAAASAAAGDTSAPSWVGDLSLQRAAMLTDVQNYLPNDILVKVDRATMSASLESRAPFLDHRVYEFAASLPEAYLYGDGQGKRVLRAALAGLVPQQLIDRPKAGFSPPIGQWLRGSLRPWAQELLHDRSAAEFLDLAECRRLLDLHTESRFDLSARLWPILSFAHWYREARSA
ncbi:asparagine synthase (glutamine-hydrolyzing) [Roseateles sp. L2-2]|uniref:asparagine synthase (glutamine-hydrolyzing) n=1 Tax=Roseateles sp. L2-2 TaxID=3422597 RepID=UPI003D3651F3